MVLEKDGRSELCRSVKKSGCIGNVMLCWKCYVSRKGNVRNNPEKQDEHGKRLSDDEYNGRNTYDGKRSRGRRKMLQLVDSTTSFQRKIQPHKKVYGRPEKME